MPTPKHIIILLNCAIPRKKKSKQAVVGIAAFLTAKRLANIYQGGEARRKAQCALLDYAMYAEYEYANANSRANIASKMYKYDTKKIANGIYIISIIVVLVIKL